MIFLVFVFWLNVFIGLDDSSLKFSTHSLDEDTWSAPLLHNTGFNYIHKNVKECLSNCCITSFKTVVENYVIKLTLPLAFGATAWSGSESWGKP